jgi:HNH endonuclease/AP2 domain
MPDLTSEELHRILHYDPETGIFTFLVQRGARRIGQKAGCPDARGHLIFSIHGRSYRAHRVAWLYVHGRWPAQQIDHIDGIRDNNAINNLREASNLENSRNSKRYVTNKSGFKGVSFCKEKNKWVAHINTKGKTKHLGYFRTPELASILYEKTAKELFGEFYKENNKTLCGLYRNK